jgi:carboxymethylenebutenolidase
MNNFARETATKLASRGFVVVAADYYRGQGPADPGTYDIDELVAAISRLDFSAAFADQLAAIDYLRGRADVATEKVVSWGYCTGGTIAWAAAALDRRLACSVIYYPSHPSFESLDDTHPFHVQDLLRVQSTPSLFMVGSEDQPLTEPVRQELKRRSVRSGDLHKFIVYPGLKHAFAGRMPGRYAPQESERSFNAALEWVSEHLERVG